MIKAEAKAETKSLEERLNNLDGGTRKRFMDELLKKVILPGDVIEGRVKLDDGDAQKLLKIRYLKDDLVPYITGRLKNEGVDFENAGGTYRFSQTLYSSINKEPMKRAFWGQFNAYVPKEIMQELHPWAAFYLYAGIWSRKSTLLPYKKLFSNTIKNQPIYKMVYDCTVEGIGAIERVHKKLHEGGRYSRLIEAPHKNEVLGIMKKPTVVSYTQINQLLLPLSC